MDYMDIVKRAWRVTWRYKILWLFGLFAGAGASAGGSGGGSGGSGGIGSGTSGGSDVAFQQFLHVVERNIVLIVAIATFVVLLGIAWWVLSIAARGGIVKLIDSAEEGRPVVASEGWRVGFENWFKVFGVSFLAGLPSALLGLLMVVVVVLAIIGAVGAGTLAARSTAMIAGAVLSSLAGACLFLVIFGVLAIVAAVALGIVKELAVRYAILEGRGVIDSLKSGWSDLWGKRGAFMMYLTAVVVGLIAVLAFGFVAIVLLLPGILAIIFRSFEVGVLLLLLGLLVLMVPGAAYGAFYHSMWTIFFRRMTGREQPLLVAGAPSYAGGFPPAPPAAPASGFPAPPSAAYAPPVPSPPAPPAAPADGGATPPPEPPAEGA